MKKLTNEYKNEIRLAINSYFDNEYKNTLNDITGEINNNFDIDTDDLDTAIEIEKFANEIIISNLQILYFLK